MKGVRKYPDANGHLSLDEGEYGKTVQGEWLACAPGGHLCILGNHSVVELADGSITVSPSIKVSGGDGQGGMKELWHGYLEAGKWREV